MDKLECAKQAAIKGGAVALRYFNSTELNVREKALNNLVTQADVESEECIVSYIKQAFPEHGFFAEENHHSGNMVEDDVWIIDPIDGTNNYAHAIPHFCISVAYAHKGEVTAGVVYDPMRNELFTASKDCGAFLNGKQIQVSHRRNLVESIITTGFNYDRGVIMEKTLETIRALFLCHIQGIRRTGSAALDMCWVASGRFDGFFEYLLSPWDFAAGMLIVREAGGICGDCSGNSLNIHANSVVVSNACIYEELLKTVRWNV
jgi:myo-inositol-1(or 4)-monophosphatase